MAMVYNVIVNDTDSLFECETMKEVKEKLNSMGEECFKGETIEIDGGKWLSGTWIIRKTYKVEWSKGKVKTKLFKEYF